MDVSEAAATLILRVACEWVHVLNYKRECRVAKTPRTKGLRSPGPAVGKRAMVVTSGSYFK